MGELSAVGRLNGSAMTVAGKSLGETLAEKRSRDEKVIKTCKSPMRENAGVLVLTGNLFDSTLMKTSVISPDFRDRFLSAPGRVNVFSATAIVFEAPEDYHDRIDDPALKIDENSILFIRGVGCVGYPGSAEVVNMLPPDDLVQQGIHHLPTVGDGCQSGRLKAHRS